MRPAFRSWQKLELEKIGTNSVAENYATAGWTIGTTTTGHRYALKSMSVHGVSRCIIVVNNRATADPLLHIFPQKNSKRFICKVIKYATTLSIF